MSDNSGEKKSGKLLKSSQFKFQSAKASFRERSSSSTSAEEVAEPGWEAPRPLPTSPSSHPSPEDVIYPDKESAAASPGPSPDIGPLNSPPASTIRQGMHSPANGGPVPPDIIGVSDTSTLFTMTNYKVLASAIDDWDDLAYMSLTDFFTLKIPDGPTTAKANDPYVVHDPLSNQFVAVALNRSTTNEPGIFLGATQDGSLMGNWQYVWISCDSLGMPSGQWFDYPRVGTSNDFLTITVNVYDANENYIGTNILAIDKLSYYKDGEVSLSVFDAGQSISIVPARTYDSISQHYLIGTGVANDGNGNCTVQVYTVVGPLTDVNIYGPTAVAVPLPYQFSGNVIAPQSGSSKLLDVGDARMQSAVVRNSSLWCCHTIFLPVTGTVAVSGIQVYELNPGQPSLTQAARYYDPNYADFYAYPSIAANSIGDVLIGMSLFNANEFPQCTYTSRAKDDSPNSLRFIGDRASSVGPYTYTGRWGDYSATFVDPSDDLSFWTLQEVCQDNVMWVVKCMQVPQITSPDE